MKTSHLKPVLVALAMFCAGCDRQTADDGSTQKRLSAIEARVQALEARGSIAPVAESKELTVEKAKRAFAEFPMGGGTFVIKGVRTGSIMGATVVDVELSNFGFTNYNQSLKYSGSAEAVFQGYSDGRWTFTELHFREPNGGEHRSFKANFTVQ